MITSFFVVDNRDYNFKAKKEFVIILDCASREACMKRGMIHSEKGRKSERRMPRLSGGEEGRGKLR